VIQLLLLLAVFICEIGLPAPVKLMLNWKPEAEFGGFYAAQINGSYAQEKLTVEITPGGVGAPTVQMVAAGRAEFGIASADEIVISRDRGTDIVALYAVYQTNPQALMVRADRKLKTIEDTFSSGLLAVQRGLPYFLFLEKKYGPMKAKVVPYLGGIAQVSENPLVTQQCFVTSEPILTDNKGLRTQTFLVADTGFNPYTSVVITRRSLIEKDPQMVAAFRRAVDAGWKAYLKDPQPANALMNRLNPSMDFPTLQKSAEIQKPLIETDASRAQGIGSMTDARWAQMASQLKSLNLIKAPLSGEAYYQKPQ
jgi:NitT/TauT family transport system substrate-binding protein